MVLTHQAWGKIERVSTDHLSAEVARAECHALLERVVVYPAAIRRQVVRQSLSGRAAAGIAAGLNIPISDVQAIMEAFNGIAQEQAL